LAELQDYVISSFAIRASKIKRCGNSKSSGTLLAYGLVPDCGRFPKLNVCNATIVKSWLLMNRSGERIDVERRFVDGGKTTDV
jgi:hypothetical protein